MGTDFSRVRLDALLDYSGVHLKQGGVLLDADANELMDILDRRARALASDVLGRATVSATTPDAFKIAIAGGGGLEIGVGRLYVDGLLAECHGARSALAAERLFDDLLDEAKFAKPVPYGAQPYPPPLSPLPTSGRHLVYLDAWRRPITHLEEPDLVETAVGVETSEREQVAWQVRIHGPVAAGATCATPDDGLTTDWEALIAPSTGRLTTGTHDVAAAQDPCELPPTGGYRGLENQLYRVEIHDPTGPAGGGATFKWSRDNASVGSRVASIVSGTELELETLGRDDLLSFKANDWVEITDDSREFARQPGMIRKIAVDAARRRITFTPALPAAMLPPAASLPNSVFPDERNLRVRRWDQKGAINRTAAGGGLAQVEDLDAPGSTGVIAVPSATTTLVLEHGVTVRFDPGGRGFRSGDYWVFAARTADASVETLDRAPPRGIHHHYARLAIWDAATGSLTDCRDKWPPKGGDDCSCTACVTAESHNSGQFTIQAAVDQVAPTGGTVCIGPGLYELRQAVRIDGAKSLRVRGHGLASMIVATAGAFEIEGSLFVGVENLGIVAIGEAPAIRVDSAIGLSLKQLAALVIGRDQRLGVAISLHGVVAAATITENLIFASTAIFADATATVNPGSTSGQGDFKFLLAAALSIDDNIFLSDNRAIALDGNVLHFLASRITGNEIIGCSGPAISALGMGLDGSSMRIGGNHLSVSGTGIRCGVEGISIDGNKLVNSGARATPPPHGIRITAGADRGGIGQCHILANQIRGFGGVGIEVDASVRALIVKQNIIENCDHGIVCITGATDGKLTVENNQLLGIGGPEAPVVIAMGIAVFQAASATIAGNTIRAFARAPAGQTFGAAIWAANVAHARILGNEAIDIGPPGVFKGTVRGILAVGALDEFDIDHNCVERESNPTQDSFDSDWQALLVTGSTAQAATASNVAAPANANMASMRVGAVGMVAFGERRFIAASRFDLPSGSILGNSIQARGTQPAVEVRADECLFNDNRVRALVGVPAVLLASRITVVSANRVRGGDPSIRIANSTGQPATVLGNITSAPIQVVGGLGTPFVPLNLIG